MANERNSPDPYRRDLADDDVQQGEHLDDKPQPGPALPERPERGARMTVHAVAIAVILGMVFHGLNSSAGPTVTSAATPQSAETSAMTPLSISPSTAQNNASKPPVAPGFRNVTPSNAQPGVTTGAASANSTKPANVESETTPTPAPRSNREFKTGTESIPGDAGHSPERRSFKRQTSHSARRRRGPRRVHRRYHSPQSHSSRAKSHSTSRAPSCAELRSCWPSASRRRQS